jgi:hypothetical protein
VHSAALPANIIKGDPRVLFYPAEPAPNANARRRDGRDFLCHGCSLVAGAHAAAGRWMRLKASTSAGCGA